MLGGRREEVNETVDRRETARRDEPKAKLASGSDWSRRVLRAVGSIGYNR
jgi:hypothetical protein